MKQKPKWVAHISRKPFDSENTFERNLERFLKALKANGHFVKGKWVMRRIRGNFRKPKTPFEKFLVDRKRKMSDHV